MIALLTRDLRLAMRAGGGFGLGLAFFLIVVVLRLWYFMELNRLSIRREIKRVELQVSLIDAKLEKILQRDSEGI